MLKRLRRNFIIVTMSLVGLVLICVQGMGLYAASTSLHSTIDTALEHAVAETSVSKPTVGIGSGNGNGYGNGSGSGTDSTTTTDKPDNGLDGVSSPTGVGRIPVYVVNLDATGAVISSNDTTVSIDSTALAKVVSTALSSSSDAGVVEEYNLAWRRATTSTGVRIAIADTSTVDQTIRSQLVTDILVCAVALGILYVITWLLAKWILGPVERSWEQQRRFIADASHELKTPLSVILANAQILKDDASNMPEKDARWVESTADEAEHMKGLVNDLLELARTDEHSVGDAGAFRKVDVDLSSIAENMALEFDAVAFERGSSIQTHIAEDVHVQGDPAELERLVKTLVDNACKYAAAGSDIDVTLARESGRAKFSVTNQGAPIDQEDLPHLFDRFYRSDKARTRDSGSDVGGYGLGLAIAKGIVDAHHGTISVTSTAEAGTRFVVTL